MGKNLTADIEVLRAIRRVHPECLFILDANEGYNSGEAIQVLEKLHGNEVLKVLERLSISADYGSIAVKIYVTVFFSGRNGGDAYSF